MSTFIRVLSLAAAVAFLAADRVSEQDLLDATTLIQHHFGVPDFTASMFEEKPYAIAWWYAEEGHPAGEALLKKSNGAWAIVKMTAGSLKDEATLESLGVPPKTAKAFVKDLTTGNVR